MRIESSALSLSATSSQKISRTVTEQLNTWKDSGNLGAISQSDQDLLAGFLENKTTSVPADNAVQAQDEFTFEISETDKIKIQLLTQMIEALTGKKLQFFRPDKPEKTAPELRMTYVNLLAKHAKQQASAPRQGWGMDYKRSESVEETAQMSFQAKGIVKLSDGKAITVNLSLNVQRSFSSQDQRSFKAGDALLDPLVVNYSSASAELTNQKFSFDLDNNGKTERIAFVKSGSGFLAYDKNEDGSINSGSELFGPATGSGFVELKAYDSDGNDWIDENDPIYDRLQIWTKDESGQDRLFAIGQLGIGAIYVKGVSSSFEIKDAANTLQGKIALTGVFVRMDGSAGTIQHVDLSI